MVVGCFHYGRSTTPKPSQPDKVHAKNAYFLQYLPFDLTGLDLADWPIEELDQSFHLALHIGNTAWKQANTANIDRSRCGAILGNIALPTEKTNALAREAFGFDTSTKTHPLNRFATGFPVGLMAKVLGFGLGGFALDAACASSLYAIKLACDALHDGRADAMIAGGMSRPDSLYTQMGFAQLKALSLSGRCSPFDESADGLMVGEGGCAFVLKRLSDALRDGDTIRGVIHGIGLSNDVDGNLLLPASEGQLRAMRIAYAQAGWQSNDVSMIECHATGTPTGDAVEFESYRRLWNGAKGDCVLGCVKSTVGHLLTGAGAAGLAKVLLSFEHKTRPATANFRKPSSKLNYGDGPFRILTKSEEWASSEAAPGRRQRLRLWRHQRPFVGRGMARANDQDERCGSAIAEAEDRGRWCGIAVGRADPRVERAGLALQDSTQ